MKIYARQVAPEFQESPLDCGYDLFEDVIITGNKELRGRTTDEFDTITKRIDEAVDCFDDLGSDSSWYTNIGELCNDYFPRTDKQHYTDEQLEKWEKILSKYGKGCTMDKSIDMCDMLELMTGIPYTYGHIRGCCQADWQSIYYPKNRYTKNDIDILEAYYFNTGSEWIVDDEGDYDPESDDPNGITGVVFYCASWDDDDIRKEIAEYAGCLPEDVVMYRFKDWKRTAIYEGVS